MDYGYGVPVVFEPDVNPEYNHLIISHNSRIRCIITTLVNLPGCKFDNMTDNEINKENILKNRFKNGCVVRICINPHYEFYEYKCMLYYEGSLDPAENKESKGYVYWGKDSFPSFSGTFPKGTNFSLEFLNLYIVRHGQASHNLSGLMAHTKKDTSLTEKGQEQAKLTGEFLQKNSETSGGFSKFKHFFASDLVRTRETFIAILSAFKDVIYPVKLIILPCAHEVPYSKDGSCDGVKNFARENQMNCIINNKGADKCNQILINDSTKRVIFEWDFYTDFYDGKTRDALYNPNRQHCQKYKFSIIDSVSAYLDPERVSRVIPPSGGKKNKKNKKSKKNKKRKTHHGNFF